MYSDTPTVVSDILPVVLLEGGLVWYLYGITRPDSAGEAVSSLPSGVGDDFPVQLVPCGCLEAIVSPVPQAEFDADALKARLRDAAWLESMVRWHQQVVEAFQRQRGVLPAKFGRVYAQLDDLTVALGPVHDALLAKLERVEGCDEWGVRIYADRAAIQRRVNKEDATVQHLQAELQSARPGRAYFLQRKLADVSSSATDQLLSDLAQAGYDRLLCCAVAGQIGQITNASRVTDGLTEILRAAFLISRAQVAGFAPEIHRFVESQEGLRCEYSGPWPPYSFA